MMSELQNYLKEHPLKPNCTLTPVVANPTVLETSGAGSLETYKQVKEACNTDQMPTIFIHFGVHGRATAINLEMCAWNEASFRVADERGWTPMHEKIVESRDAKLPLWTSVDVPYTIEKLLIRGHKVIPSTDAGRFVCNWIFYNSLHLCSSATEHALFVHVPPFDVMDKSTQLACIHDLLEVLTEWIADQATAKR
jgi:pyroglutamyl-peptidase